MTALSGKLRFLHQMLTGNTVGLRENASYVCVHIVVAPPGQGDGVMYGEFFSHIQNRLFVVLTSMWVFDKQEISNVVMLSRKSVPVFH